MTDAKYGNEFHNCEGGPASEAKWREKIETEEEKKKSNFVLQNIICIGTHAELIPMNKIRQNENL